MIQKLRNLSARPELVVGDDSRVLESPTSPTPPTQVGLAGPLGRERVIFAIPTNGTGPVQLAPARTVQGDGALLADPDNNVIGFAGFVWVHRMLYAGKTESTRRLG